MRPLVSQLVKQINVAKRTEHAAHEPTLADSLLDRGEAVIDGPLRTHHSCYSTGKLARQIECTSDCLLASLHRVRKVLHRLEPWEDDGDWNHPYAVLYAGWEDSDLGEKPLVCRPSHNLVRVAFRSAIRPDDYNRWTQILDEVPARTSNGEYVEIVIHTSQDIERCVMLEKKIHFDAYTANVLEHIAELHVLRI